MSESRKRKFRYIFPAWDFVEFTLARMAMALLNLFPIAISTWIARRIGKVIFLIMASRRKVAFNNLAIAFGNSKSESERRMIALESFRHLMTSLMEFFRLSKSSIQEIKQGVYIKGTEYLDHAFSKGKGVVLILSHLGPWEYMGFLTYLKKHPTVVLGRPIRNLYFYQWVKSLRKTVNLDYIDKTLRPKKIFSGLRQNHLVAIMIDQWAGNEGLWIDFFGIPTSTTSLPARLAKRTGCALIYARCIRVASGKYEINILPEISIEDNGENWVENMTKRINCLLEEEISSFPEQWLWTHKRWKGKRIAKSVD